jgi:hypothetical protein
VAKIGEAHGYLILPEQGGREFRVDASDLESASRRLQAIVREKLPSTVEGYEHDGLQVKEHDLGLPPFLSTIEIMRRAVRLGLMPWETMQALQNLYLGKIMQNDYLGESEI